MKYEIKYMRYEKLCTVIEADFEKKQIRFANATSFAINRAFGNNESPTWEVSKNSWRADAQAESVSI